MLESLKLYLEDLMIPSGFDGTSQLKSYYDSTQTLSIFRRKKSGYKNDIKLKVISKDEFSCIVYLSSGIILNDEVKSHHID